MNFRSFFCKFAVILAFGLVGNLSYAASLLFDGDFESGTFQGWTPGGTNGGFASLAAKGTCYSGNDTTAISFNGNPANNYAALLRSNPSGDPASVASLRSANFPAGNGILFSALSETSGGRNSEKPVNFLVRILDSDGKVLSELPLRTQVIDLSAGCPSEKRDTAFSVHYVDTRPYNGEISVEFVQHTLTSGFGYFTLVDNVFLVEKGEVFVNQTQPIAIAGSSLTSSGILFLDPRESLDPDELPAPLEFSWFINGEETIRLYDMPCINLNSDIELEAGNHTATLYATDGVNYSADTLRFVVGGANTATTLPEDDTSNITLTTPEGDPIVNEVNLVSADGVTQTDPQNECDIDVADIIDESDDIAEDGEVIIDVDSTSDEIFDTTFTVGGDPVSLTSGSVDVQSSSTASIVSVTVSIDNPDSGDSINVDSNPVSTLTISNEGTSSVTITPDNAGDEVSDSDYETVLEALLFEYIVDGGVNTDQRSVTYIATDSEGNTGTATSTITVVE